MKKLLDILETAGVKIPEDKQADVKKAFFENFKAVGEFNKRIGQLEQERDGYKSQLDALQETVKGFEGLEVVGEKG